MDNQSLLDYLAERIQAKKEGEEVKPLTIKEAQEKFGEEVL